MPTETAESALVVPAPGDLMLVKTTEEPVIILEASPAANPSVNGISGLSGIRLRVRRPVSGKDGIRHEVSEFFLEELETPIERTRRLHADYTASQKLVMGSKSPNVVEEAVSESIN